VEIIQVVHEDHQVDRKVHQAEEDKVMAADGRALLETLLEVAEVTHLLVDKVYLSRV
jgi:hypothetical protein